MFPEGGARRILQEVRKNFLQKDAMGANRRREEEFFTEGNKGNKEKRAEEFFTEGRKGRKEKRGGRIFYRRKQREQRKELESLGFGGPFITREGFWLARIFHPILDLQ